MVINSDINEIIRKYTVQNALQHDGKAQVNTVISKLMGECPELRPQIKELIPVITKMVNEINSMDISEQRSELEQTAPELLHKEKREKRLVLPELPNIGSYTHVVMRFAPGPSGPLHIGHSRAIVLNDEYVKRYNGKLILRFEDTNPHNIEPSAYDMIPADLDWLEVKYHEICKQSDRFDIYYKWTKKLIEGGFAYVCTCPVEHWRSLKTNSTACPDRDLEVETHLLRWEAMLNRDYKPGEVSLVIKTDLHHPNPAVRDFVGMRIITEKHPITADKYSVYPTYNLSVAIDDHLMGITHILRGKDHLNNTFRQKYIYKYLGWPTPEFLHYGWVSLPDVILKTTSIKEGIREGRYTGWSDIQLGTLQALAQRGIKPEAIKRYWLDVGIKEVDIEFSWQTLYALNRDIIHKEANRYFFVSDPVPLLIRGIAELTGHAPLHPDDQTRGFRDTKLYAKELANEDGKVISVLVSNEDLAQLELGSKIRLKDLCNVVFTKKDITGVSNADYFVNALSILKEGAKIIHWVPSSANHPTVVHHPNGIDIKGYSEPDTINALGKTIQFERFGFVRLGTESVPAIEGWFTHK